ncbi:BREX-1 system adenine-specific DNA-methyltransferase PglX [Marispirochaeta aestuarii]|uniref:BREX-1 system adenine-specific DNA-methyltransferase PglX n=1 Tax=Marispirochaeta aestuarii TaxID=1963862 RepID=UPI0029C65AC2|nr:BREX-1 system adenine-specific DNA-methyltransferase PglX [Marispirochaeta aestuarii]
MDHSALKNFAQKTRKKLINQIGTRLDYVESHDDPYLRAHGKEKEIIEKLLEQKGRNQLLEETAYIWFNRLTALRFMDNRGYNPVRIVSPREGEIQPELLAQLKQGTSPAEIKPAAAEATGYINGSISAADPDREAYKTLLLAWCNAMGRKMPFLFERIDDWAALLLPQDLLSEESVITDIQRGITPDDCIDVEIIGWLYQYYISEKKNEVFEGLRKNRKIGPENIPAATQLFTPHWIVRYLVENSLGRLWMLNNPDSALIDFMDYYIPPEEPETEYLQVSGPEELKICDPACGSGHMLTYAFDLLYKIYEEEGYAPSEIPEKIVSNNLYGIEVDSRAGALAAFALIMKATDRQRHFLKSPVLPNICVVEKIQFEEKELSAYMDYMGRELFSEALTGTLKQFEEADNFGSLIRPELTATADIARTLRNKGVAGHLFLGDIHRKVLTVLEQAEYLSPRYHVVIANPPYMGGKGMNRSLSAWAKTNYPDSKSDLFAMFIERNLEMIVQKGAVGMITMQSWMFLSSFEKLRAKLLDNHTLVSMAHIGARGFDSIGGEVVSTTAFIIQRGHLPHYKGGFLRLVDGSNEAEKDRMMREIVEKVKA